MNLGAGQGAHAPDGSRFVSRLDGSGFESLAAHPIPAPTARTTRIDHRAQPGHNALLPSAGGWPFQDQRTLSHSHNVLVTDCGHSSFCISTTPEPHTGAG